MKRPPAWHRYEPCPDCRAPTGRPCVDLRTQRAGHQPPKPLIKKHDRRRRRSTGEGTSR